jgi:uncharacterized phage protein (TIGR02220 family)
MAEPTKSYYAIITADVRYDDSLSANAKLLYGELTCLCNEKGDCWATNGYFAKLYGVSKVTVSRWINQLKDKGYIKVDLRAKDNTTMEQARFISIVNTPYQKCYAPLNKNDKPPHNKNDKDNNTRINKNSDNESGKPDHAEERAEIIDYLNEKSGKAYKPNSAKTKTLISARLNEGFTVQDFKTVIDNKTSSWLGNNDMEKYLRPETLFGNKFEGYLNEGHRFRPEAIATSHDNDDGFYME